MSSKNNTHIPQPSKDVAVVVPLHDREGLTAEEEISKNHLVHYLGSYDKYVIAPENLNVSHPGFKVVRFDDKFFGSVNANKRLMLSRSFYETFQDYECILIYHLDSLVFSDQLMQWCDTGVDYIGPPWFKCEDTPHITSPGVGNGGFSLRNVKGFLRVFDSSEYTITPEQYWAKNFEFRSPFIRFISRPRKYLKLLKVFNNVRREMDRYRHNEDMFWAEEARKYNPDFKIASFDTALRFAFEVAPRQCFEMTKGTLPFGCHAWSRYDREFWEPFLLK